MPKSLDASVVKEYREYDFPEGEIIKLDDFSLIDLFDFHEYAPCSIKLHYSGKANAKYFSGVLRDFYLIDGKLYFLSEIKKGVRTVSALIDIDHDDKFVHFGVSNGSLKIHHDKYRHNHEDMSFSLSWNSIDKDELSAINERIKFGNEHSRNVAKARKKVLGLLALVFASCAGIGSCTVSKVNSMLNSPNDQIVDSEK